MEGPRPPRRRELAQVAQLHERVFGVTHREEAASEGPVARSRGVRPKRVLIVVEDGRPASHIAMYYDAVSLLGCRVRTASISGVCTAPESRGRGYAGLILDYCLREAEARGTRVLIVSGDRGLYQRAGCRAVGVMHSATARPEHLPQPRRSAHVRRGGPEDESLIRALHSREPVRFYRCADTWAELHAAWRRGWPEAWIVEWCGVPLAYLWVGPLWRPPREPIREVYEYAGSRLAIAEALPGLVRALGLRELVFSFPGWEQELVSLLTERGIQSRPGPLPGTHRLLDLPGLMRDLAPYLAERLPRSIRRDLSFGQSRDRCFFSFREESVELDLGAAAELVLGGPASPATAGQLGEVLAQILPVPFPSPGMNMV